MLILERQHDLPPRSILCHIIYDWRLFDLFVREFGDMFGDATFSHLPKKYTLPDCHDQFHIDDLKDMHSTATADSAVVIVMMCSRDSTYA